MSSAGAAAPASMTPDELAETRRKAGFQDSATLEAEARRGPRAGRAGYVRANPAGYREVVRALRGNVAEIERASRRWLRASDPQRALERWRGISRRRADRVAGLYQHLADDGFDGGQVQRLLADAYRRWEELREDLGGEVRCRRASPPSSSISATLSPPCHACSTRSSTTKNWPRGHEFRRLAIILRALRVRHSRSWYRPSFAVPG